jgi:hypothetical protein
MLAIRPDSWNFPLLVHVASAMVLVAAVTVATVALIQALRTPDNSAAVSLQRFGSRTLLYVAIPFSILLNIDAEWIKSREFSSSAKDPAWIGWGYGTAEGSLVFLVIAAALSGLALRRSRTGAGLGNFSRAATVLTLLALATLVIAVWAMTTKPM